MLYVITIIVYIHVAGPPGGDYNGASGILTFSASTEQMVIISVNNDDETEETESFFVDLSLLDGTVCSTATVFILDDEPTEPPPTTPRTLIVKIKFGFIHYW